MKTSVFTISEECAASDHCTLLTVARDQHTTWQSVVGTTDKNTRFKKATAFRKSVLCLCQVKVWH